MLSTERFVPNMAIRLEQLTPGACSDVVVHVRAIAATSSCPVCAQASSRVHSRYIRHPADLPWVGLPARLLLQVRRFFCTNPTCARRIFTERLPTLVQPSARRTVRLAQAQQQIGLRVGGRAGSRLAHHVGMPTGRDTLLTLVRRIALPPPAAPRVVGIDDWARRKGHSYGTICVDLETHRPIDLLADRSVDGVSQWLRARPSIEVVSRDRAVGYAEAVTIGAPTAVQVVDRWHLLKNVGDMAVRVLQQHHVAVRRALEPPPADVAPPALPERPAPPLAEVLVYHSPRQQAATDARRAARLARVTEVCTLHQQGWSLHAIAAQTSLDRKTVRKYVRLTDLPKPQPRGARGSKLDPYKPYLLERWNAGCRNGAQLLQEIASRGYDGQRSILKTYVTALRKHQGLAPRSRSIMPGATTPVLAQRRPSLQTLAWLVVREPQTRATPEQTLLAQVVQAHPEVEQMVTLVQQFAALVRHRPAQGLDDWLARAAASGIGAVQSFVVSLRTDLASVRNALSLEWSNGPVEGHVNRLKLLKRQSYGRANFDLLRLRVLALS